MTAYILKFVSILKGRSETTELTIEALSEAERRWIIDSQSTQEEDLKFPTWKIQFCLFKDDSQVWRCGGRLQNANILFSSKHPILLNKQHALMTLIVQFAHQTAGDEVRAKYWVIGGRSLVGL